MLLTSTQTLTDQPYEELGLVRAASVYSKNIAKDIGQSLKSVVGGSCSAIPICSKRPSKPSPPSSKTAPRPSAQTP